MSSTRTFEAAWYTHGYLRELVLIYPSYAIMMGAAGITPMQLSILFIIWSASALVFEVPSGTAADIYSRKWLLVMANLLKASAFVAWIAAPTFWGYALGFIVWGLGSSLTSGTSEALLYDTLKRRGDPESFSRIYGRGSAASSLGVATALFCGGFVAEQGFALPLYLSALAPCAAAAVAAFAFADARTLGDQTRDFAATLGRGIRLARRNRAVAHLIMLFAVFVAIYGSLEEFMGPYLNEKTAIPLGTIGLVYGCAYAARSLGTAFAHRLGTRSARTIAIGFGATAAPLAITQVDSALGAGLAFALYFAACAACEILTQDRLQAAIDDDTRATVTSVAGMGMQIMGIGAYLVIGTVASWLDWHAAVAAVAGLTLLAATVFRVFASNSATAGVQR